MHVVLQSACHVRRACRWRKRSTSSPSRSKMSHEAERDHSAALSDTGATADAGAAADTGFDIPVDERQSRSTRSRRLRRAEVGSDGSRPRHVETFGEHVTLDERNFFEVLRAHTSHDECRHAPTHDHRTPASIVAPFRPPYSSSTRARVRTTPVLPSKRRFAGGEKGNSIHGSRRRPYREEVESGAHDAVVERVRAGARSSPGSSRGAGGRAGVQPIRLERARVRRRRRVVGHRQRQRWNGRARRNIRRRQRW